jgi:hypothetical protein
MVKEEAEKTTEMAKEETEETAEKAKKKMEWWSHLLYRYVKEYDSLKCDS